MRLAVPMASLQSSSNYLSSSLPLVCPTMLLIPTRMMIALVPRLAVMLILFLICSCRTIISATQLVPLLPVIMFPPLPSFIRRVLGITLLITVPSQYAHLFIRSFHAALLMPSNPFFLISLISRRSRVKQVSHASLPHGLCRT